MEGREGELSNRGFSAGPGGAGNESSLPPSPSSSSPLEIPSLNRGLGWRLRGTCCPLLLLGSCVARDSAAHGPGQLWVLAVRLSWSGAPAASCCCCCWACAWLCESAAHCRS